MRRLEYLLNKVRRRTNNMKTARYSDDMLTDMFNDSQREIQRIAVTAHNNSNLFSKEHYEQLISGQDKYSLPEDIFSINSMNSVERRYSGVGWYTPMRKISQKERGSAVGYILLSSTLIVSPSPQITQDSGLRLTYTKIIPTLSKRYGKISATGANTITIPINSDDPSLLDGKITVIDSAGEIVQNKLDVESYVAATGIITTVEAISGNVAVNMYVCAGEDATTNSELPDTCEYVLTSIVERMIYLSDSSSDYAPADAISNKLRNRIVDLFADNNRDVDYPEIVDDTYLN